MQDLQIFKFDNQMEDTSQLATAALLYIASNMPSLNEGLKIRVRFAIIPNLI